jgi:hypothetical protein
MDRDGDHRKEFVSDYSLQITDCGFVICNSKPHITSDQRKRKPRIARIGAERHTVSNHSAAGDVFPFGPINGGQAETLIAEK